MPGRARMGQVRRQPCAEEMQWVGWFPKQHPHDAGGGMQAGSWSWWGGGQDTLGTHGVVLGSSGRGISGPCSVRMGARWVLAEGAGCSSAAASLLVSGEGSLPRGWMLQGGGKHPAKSQPLSQHTELQLLQKAERRKFKHSSPAGTQSCRSPSGCSWMGCPGLALPPTALQTLRAGQPLLLPWKSVCTATVKKIVNEKTRWKRGSKLNATAVMLHLSCEGKIKFCLPLEVSSGKIISSLAKWHHIVSSFQPAASLVSQSIFFQENTRVT